MADVSTDSTEPGEPPACQCGAHPHRCHDPATGEDGLCDHCRAGCVLVGDGTYHVHICLWISDEGIREHDIRSRMQRVREHPRDVTLETIRDWVSSTMRITEGSMRHTRGDGLRAAARDVQAILAMHGRPAGEAVVFETDPDGG